MFSLSTGNNVSKLKWGEKLQNFPGMVIPPRFQLYLKQTNLVRQGLAFLRWKYAKITSYSLFEHPGFCLIFILSKKKHFQSETLLKMPPLSPTIEEFVLDIQK